MYRDIFTNKWVLGGVGFLIVLSVACVLWYQHDIAPHRKAAADAEKLLRQLEITKMISDANGVTELAAKALAESTTPTAEKTIKPTTDITSPVSPPVTKDTAPTQAQNGEAPAAIAEARVSPYGFGTYPEVPEDYPSKHLVKWPAQSPGAELLYRVLIKLWSSGEKNFRGGSTYNGKIYPHYHDTVYVRFAEYRGADGKMVRYAARTKSGPGVSSKYTQADLLNPPPHLRVLDLDSSGIDPHQYLNLREK
ncbi:MAG: hypothetical protein OXU23_28175 [Candidatus Poribacteria bacterium]|nr:hypothetical protein [Candidatus Poribacteria bacterium]